MTATLPRYSKEVFAERGEAIYDRDVRPKLTSEADGQVVVIDIETGSYEVDVDEIAASDRLLARCPDAQIWFRRVGKGPVRRFGPRPSGLPK